MRSLMGRKLFLLLLLVFPLLSMGNNKAESQFAKGNELYAKAKYKEAALAYQRVLDAGFASAAVYFNLGNAHYKLGEMPMAIWNYEKAYKLSPGDEDIQTNIQFANLKITDKIEAVPEFFLTKWWRSLILFCSYEVLSVLGAAGFIIGFALLIVYLFATAIAVKRSAFYAGIVVISLGVLLTGMAGLQNSYLDSSNSAVVFAGTVNVKSGPKDNLKNLFVIHEGIKVAVKERAEDWVKIELPNGNIGWIKSAGLREI
jgi:tetratricopeptide (TPR) repeat protein